MSDEKEVKEKSKHSKGPVSASDIQRARLEKLMKNPDKPAFVPEPKKEKDPKKTADFVYNVMGSSAGAGSGEFHVYRQIRRKEFTRKAFYEKELEKDRLDKEFAKEREEKDKLAQEKSDKKRAKRMKKKEAAKKRKLQQKKNKNKKESSSSSSESSSNEESDKE